MTKLRDTYNVILEYGAGTNKLYIKKKYQVDCKLTAILDVSVYYHQSIPSQINELKTPAYCMGDVFLYSIKHK